MGKIKNTMWGMFREAAVSVLRDVTGGGGGTIERAPGLLPVGTILGLDDMVDAYTASSVACVKRCVEIKAGSVASLGLHAMRRRMEDGRTWYEDAEGTVADRLLSERPNPRQTGFDLLWQVVYQREMYGNAYIVPVYRGGVLSALYCVPSDCSVSYDRLRSVYTVNDIYDGIEGEYMPDEIIHVRSYCRDGFMGTPVTELASLVLSNARKAYKQEGEMFTPGSTLRGFITGEDTVQVGYGGATDKQLKGVTQRIREAIGSGQNLNFLPGTMKFVQTGMTPSDLQLLDSMKFINMEICRFFGVPPMQVFQDTNANYSSTESSQTIFMTSTLAPLMRQIKSEVTEKLFGGDGHMRARFRIDDYYQTDPSAQATALSQLIQTVRWKAATTSWPIAVWRSSERVRARSRRPGWCLFLNHIPIRKRRKWSNIDTTHRRNCVPRPTVGRSRAACFSTAPARCFCTTGTMAAYLRRSLPAPCRRT